MDAASIELILTALAAASGAGLASGVQDATGKAVNTTYEALASRISKLLQRRAPLPETASSGKLSPDDILAKFRLDPDRWGPDLAEMLEAAPEPDDKLLALLSDKGELAQHTFVDNSENVQIANSSYKPIQVNYNVSRRARPRHDSTAD